MGPRGERTRAGTPSHSTDAINPPTGWKSPCNAHGQSSCMFYLFIFFAFYLIGPFSRDHSRLGRVPEGLRNKNHCELLMRDFFTGGCPSCHPTDSIKALEEHLSLCLSANKVIFSKRLLADFDETSCRRAVCPRPSPRQRSSSFPRPTRSHISHPPLQPPDASTRR